MKLFFDDCFLQGEKIFLRKPNIEKDIVNGNWHQWFNDMEITKHLVHGVYPNSSDEQIKIVEVELSRSNSILLSIIDKETEKMLGIISLKSIDLINRNAEIAIVMGFEKKPGVAIEAMALLTQHAFDRLNLQKIYAGQHEELWSWINTLKTIGYKIEGIRRKGGYRDGKSYDIILTGITDEDYYSLKMERGGKLIDSFEKTYKRKNKINFIAEIKKIIKNINN
jgi:ribosomal-protein-alanine N-acetyltransferase